MKTFVLDLVALRTLFIAAVFVAGGLLLPALCHMVPLAGAVWLPIFFFTLVAAARYGLAAGLWVAVATPCLNHLLTAMPAAPMLPVVLSKSVLLAVLAATVCRCDFAGASSSETAPSQSRLMPWLRLAGVIVAYQLLGACLDAAFFSHSAEVAWHAVQIAVPGMLLQLVAGKLLLDRL